MLWSSASTRLNQTMENDEIKIAKFHEVVDMAIMDTITLPFADTHTPRTCMLRSVAAVLHRTPHKDWDVNREMKGWGMEGRPVLCPLSMMVAMKILMNDVSVVPRRSCVCIFSSSSGSSPKREAVSTVKKEQCDI